MKKIVQFHIHKGEKYYIAESLDLPIVTQGKTIDELAENIKEAVSLQLENENPETFDLDKKPSILLNLELTSGINAQA